jgi:hypothetical protein
MLFYGPGNVSLINWESLNLEHRNAVAANAGISNATIQRANNQLVFIGPRNLNWREVANAGAKTYVERLTSSAKLYVGLRLTRAALGGSALALESYYYRTGAKAADRAAIRLATAFRLTGRVGGRLIPYVGTALIAYDVYTLTTRGEIWGVEVFEK